MSSVYLDYNASSPLDPRVLEAMLPYLTNQFGNAASAHHIGQAQSAAVEDARAEVAELVGGRSSGVVFTSGATEANNLALKGLTEPGVEDRRRIIVSAGEHASVRAVAAWLVDSGQAKVDTAPLKPSGAIDLDALDELLGDDVLVVSALAANSETGILNPINTIAERAHAVGALYHCDATQLVGRLPFDLTATGADLVSISGHKICGPSGTGALVLGADIRSRLTPQIHGGGHERGLRSGSVNVAGAVGLGAAATIAHREYLTDAQRVSAFRDQLVGTLQDRLPEVSQIGDLDARLPNTASVRFASADAQAVLVNMTPVAASSGSACSSGAIEPSPVLTAMGLNRTEADEVIRFSLGRFTTAEDIATAVERVVAAVHFVRGRRMTQ